MLNKKILVSVLGTGLLLGLGWPPLPLTFLLFIGFLPLFIFSDSMLVSEKKTPVFIYAFLALLIRNLIILHWIAMVTPSGCLLIVILLSILFGLVIAAFHWFRQRIAARWAGYILLTSLWICAEWIAEHLLKCPWTNMGLGMAKPFSLVQWYEYTGIAGGTLWILLINIMLYESYRVFKPGPVPYSRKIKWTLGSGTLLCFLIPAVYSYTVYVNYLSSMNAVQVVAVQSNFSPGTKFDPKTSEKSLDLLIKLSKKGAQTSTEYFIWPETALEPWHALNEDSLNGNSGIAKIRSFLRLYPNASILTGALTYRMNAAHPADTNFYNSALAIESSDRIQIYHKSILVPGTETTMFQDKNGRAKGLYLYLGGLSKTFSTTKNDIFYSPTGLGVAPVICFESVFSSYVAHSLVYKGAGLIAVISNDAWWGNSAGTWQHMEYMRLLAIESRRAIACASNGGISSLIDQKGNAVNKSSPGIEAVLSAELTAREELTFFSAWPDLIPSASLIIATLTLICGILYQLTGKRTRA